MNELAFRLRGSELRLFVRFGHAVPLEDEPIAAIGTGKDRRDVGNWLLGGPVEGEGSGHASPPM